MLPVGNGIGPSSINVDQFLAPILTLSIVVIPPTQPAVHPVMVGGEMLPVNLVQILAPWIAALLTLTIVAVATLAVRKNKRKR